MCPGGLPEFMCMGDAHAGLNWHLMSLCKAESGCKSDLHGQNPSGSEIQYALEACGCQRWGLANEFPCFEGHARLTGREPTPG